MKHCALVTLITFAVLFTGVVSCNAPHVRGPLPTPARVANLTPVAPPSLADTLPRDYPGLHNNVSYHEGFVSGSVPEGDAGFDTLAAMGVKTIISVDGMTPDVERARERGIRYIHLPIGYNGFSNARRLELTRATRDALVDGPVFIHCHHGKHRSAGAAAAVAVGLGWMNADESVARMKVSGTAPNYTGLYACAANATLVGAGALDAVHGNFPEVSKPAGLVQGMLDIDEAFENLKAIEKAGWAVPTDHPDLVPVAEAGRLAETYRTLAALPSIAQRSAEFVAMLRDANAKGQALEEMLAAGGADNEKLTAGLKEIGETCKACHSVYRDKP